MEVVKSTGERVRFEPGKIRGSLLRAGATKAVADRVANAVTERVTDGMPTRRITALVRQQLQREHRALMYRYTLREALLKLGPAGFSFEKYVASILQAHGYRTTMPEELPGKCVRHEVDVVAEKDGRRIMIEAKFRNDFEYFVRLKDVMATWARFIDLNEGPLGRAKPFDEVWVVTNGRISTRSQAFGACRGVRLLGWNYPADKSFAAFVDHAALYPVTVLRDLTPGEIARFSDKGIMLCREAASHNPKRLSKRVGMSQRRAEEIVGICRQVVATGPVREGGTDLTA
jgi:hypothetical protein